MNEDDLRFKKDEISILLLITYIILLIMSKALFLPILSIL